MDLILLVGATGFEPATPCAQGRCATRLRYAPTLNRRSILRYVLHPRVRLCGTRFNATGIDCATKPRVIVRRSKTTTESQSFLGDGGIEWENGAEHCS